MSAIKIKGTASGAATFTIEPPSTNTNRTLNLPDSAGTLLDDTSSLSSSKLSGALPAISGGNLTGVGILSSDQSWTGSQRSALVVDNDGSFNMNSGNNFKCTVSSGTVQLSFTNIPNGQSGFILLINSGATITASGATKVDANILATLSTAGTYLISYLSDGSNVYLTNSAVYL